MLSFSTKRGISAVVKNTLFSKGMRLSLIKVHMNYCLCFYFCPIIIVVQWFVGSVVNWTDFEVVVSHENLTFDSEVTWQYRRVTGLIVNSLPTVTVRSSTIDLLTPLSALNHRFTVDVQFLLNEIIILCDAAYRIHAGFVASRRSLTKARLHHGD